MDISRPKWLTLIAEIFLTARRKFSHRIIAGLRPLRLRAEILCPGTPWQAEQPAESAEAPLAPPGQSTPTIYQRTKVSQVQKPTRWWRSVASCLRQPRAAGPAPSPPLRPTAGPGPRPVRAGGRGRLGEPRRAEPPGSSCPAARRRKGRGSSPARAAALRGLRARRGGRPGPADAALRAAAAREAPPG